MMYPKYHILVLGLVLLGHGSQGKTYNEQAGHAVQPDSGSYFDDIYLDEQQQLWLPADLDSSEEASGQEGSGYEGSADDDAPTSLCMQMRKQLLAHQEAYIPECTEDGEYEPLQCNGETSECWCVTQNGDRIPNTLRRQPHKPKCGNRGGGPPHVKPKPGAGPSGEPDDSSSNDDDISIDDNVIDEETHTDDNSNTNKINPIPEIIQAEDGERGSGFSNPESEPIKASGIWGEPGILAGIIGGAVVGLLCAVLLVMFIVYRMRKKDEGSYALDEPKRSPSHGYQKARDREYFA